MKNVRKVILSATLVVLLACSSCKGDAETVSSKKNHISSNVTSSVSTSSHTETSSIIDVIASSELQSTSSEIKNTSSETKSSAPVSSNIQISADISALDNAKKGWGPGTVKNHARPKYAVDSNTLYNKYDAIFVGEDNKNVYLTFDEGYENGYTAPILDTLKEKNVKAVFFVTYDYVNRNAELVKRMIDEGHIVGNHSWSHPSMPSLTEEKMINQVIKLHNLVKEKFGYEMKYFRPPMGEFSEKSLAVCKSLGYKSVFWSFAYVDWNADNQPDEAASLEKITNSSHNGAIYLLHAVSKTNSNILGNVIDDVKQQGFTWCEFNL
jgi:peptidoglycan-N-acetylmuramic acid deacetylase